VTTDDIAANLTASLDGVKAAIASYIARVDAGEYSYQMQLRIDLERAATLNAMIAMLTEVRGA
jgi:hypothetical protein